MLYQTEIHEQDSEHTANSALYLGDDSEPGSSSRGGSQELESVPETARKRAKTTLEKCSESFNQQQGEKVL